MRGTAAYDDAQLAPGTPGAQSPGEWAWSCQVPARQDATVLQLGSTLVPHSQVTFWLAAGHGAPDALGGFAGQGNPVLFPELEPLPAPEPELEPPPLLALPLLEAEPASPPASGLGLPVTEPPHARAPRMQACRTRFASS
jgi:hypothetical protein